MPKPMTFDEWMDTYIKAVGNPDNGPNRVDCLVAWEAAEQVGRASLREEVVAECERLRNIVRDKEYNTLQECGNMAMADVIVQWLKGGG